METAQQWFEGTRDRYLPLIADWLELSRGDWSVRLPEWWDDLCKIRDIAESGSYHGLAVCLRCGCLALVLRDGRFRRHTGSSSFGPYNCPGGRERVDEQAPTPPAAPPRLPPAGGHGAFKNYQAGCRCERCREANRVRHAAQRADRRARGGLPPGDSRHGTHTGYTNWCCRCDPCRAAGSDLNRRTRLARETRAAREDR